MQEEVNQLNMSVCERPGLEPIICVLSFVADILRNWFMAQVLSHNKKACEVKIKKCENYYDFIIIIDNYWHNNFHNKLNE